MLHSAAELRRVVRMQSDRRVHVGVPIGERQRGLRGFEIGADAHHPLHARGARPLDVLVAARELQVAVGVDPHRSSVSLRGNSGSPFSSVAPAGNCPHAAAAGTRWSSGRPGRPSRRHNSAAAFGNHRRREQRDDAQRFETVAEHLRDRGRVALLC